MGFIPRRQGWFNIQKSVNIIYLVNLLKKKYYINIPIYVEKHLPNLTLIHDKNHQCTKWRGGLLHLDKEM